VSGGGTVKSNAGTRRIGLFLERVLSSGRNLNLQTRDDVWNVELSSPPELFSIPNRIGLVPTAAGVFDLCLLAPLAGMPFFGRQLREVLDRQRR